MTPQEKSMWLAAAENWKMLKQTADNFIAQGNDITWWKIKKLECERNYRFCMLRATDPIHKHQTAIV